jgi:hypothetical protein
MGKNLRIIQDWVDGNNMRPTSINFVTDKVEVNKKKSAMNIGDIYIDDDGKEWVKTTYGWASIPKVLKAIKDTAPHCSACQKEIELGSRDDKFYSQTKLCFDCTIEMDTKRKLNGTFENYQEQFVFKKQRDYVMDMLSNLKEGLKALDTKQTVEFVNEFGDRESWSGLNVDKIRAEIEKDILEGEEILKNINEQLEKISVSKN